MEKNVNLIVRAVSTQAIATLAFMLEASIAANIEL
jgi:hypothetical protein